MNEEIFLKLWAKSDPRHYLWRHLLDVAAVAEALWPRFGPLEDMPPCWAYYLCALHDIGKADPWFQNKNQTLSDELVKLGLEMPERLDTTDEQRRLFRHEARSREWMQKHLTAQHDWDSDAALAVLHAINGHHGNFGASCYSERDLKTQRATWQPLRDELAQLVWNTLEPPPYAPRDFDHAGAVGVALSGLIILADWIASNHDVYDYRQLHKFETAQTYFEAAQKLAQKVVSEMKLDAPLPFNVHEPPRFGAVWPDIAATMRPLQSTLEGVILDAATAPGLAIIEEQMGQGKTEAAIYLAEWWNTQRGAQGMYVGLPTQATSNQMFDRYEEYLKRRRPGDATRLVHGMAWIFDEESPDDVSQTYGENQKTERLLTREWFRPLRRALLASDGVGTIDQALLAALHVKFGVLRLLGLRSKVLIVDEAHAYDEYMTTILEQLLKWCRALGIPVILLSATLSARQKKRLIAAYGGDQTKIETGGKVAYPLLTFSSLQGTTHTVAVLPKVQKQRELRVELQHGFLDDATKIARHALQDIQNGGCACVLMNTIKGAQDVFRAVEDLLKQKEFERPDALQLFHARFRAEARREIEERVTGWFGKDATLENGRRPRRAILIATQVVEQSLDVDFDFFLSQIAPIDLLLQRSGRMWRHERKTRFGTQPVLGVLLPQQGELQFGVSEKVYAREILLRTLAALHEYQTIKLPRHFRPLIEAVYGDELLESEIVPRVEIEKAAQKWKTEQDTARAAANVNLLPDPDPRAFEWVGRDKAEADEGAAKNYLRVSTRLGDESRAALVLHDPDLIATAQSSQTEKPKYPGRKKMKLLFAHKVNLPAWWLRELEPATGYEAIFEGENWLRGHLIIALRKGEWHAKSGAILCDDAKMGLTFKPGTQQEKGEADAGLTG